MSILLLSSFQNFLQLMGTLLIFLLVLIVTWMVTRWIGGYQKTQMSNKNLKLLETIRVGNNKLISVVQAGGAYYVVAIGKDEIHLLGELDEKQAAVFAAAGDMEDRYSQDSFQNLLEKVREKLPKK